MIPEGIDNYIADSKADAENNLLHRLSQLQQLLKEKDAEIEFKDKHIKMCKAEWDGWKEKAEQLQQLLSEKEKEIEYWKQRCEAAEDVFYRESFPGEPAWEKWQQLKSQEPTSPPE